MMNTLRSLQIWLAVGLIGVLIYFYTATISSGADVSRYRQLCVINRAHTLSQAKIPPQCPSLGSTILIATFGPDLGIILALVGFYISLMTEANLIYERKINQINRS
jgi:uncharacterized membrane protein